MFLPRKEACVQEWACDKASLQLEVKNIHSWMLTPPSEFQWENKLDESKATGHVREGKKFFKDV